MKTNRFNKLLFTLYSIAAAGCIVSLFSIVFYYFWRIGRLPGGEEYWSERFHMHVAIFAFSLLLGLGCLAAHRIRKKTKNKSRKRHDLI